MPLVTISSSRRILLHGVTYLVKFGTKANLKPFSFSGTEISCRNFVMVPVTAAPAEQSFSKHKIIHYLITTCLKRE
jgi:hypothetical protein